MSGQLVALQVIDKVVVAGYGVGTGFKLTRIDTNGVVDSAFGTGGSVDTLIGTSSAAVAVAIQLDGGIVAAGNAVTTAGVLSVAIARYLGGP